ATLPLDDGQTLRVTDTVSPGDFATDDARQVIKGLLWPAQTFRVDCSKDGDAADLSLSFPSPLPQGNDVWDRAVLDWYIARRHGEPAAGPAVVVLDILQGGNLVSGFIARTLAKHGIHGFVLHMPQNGRRKRIGDVHDWSAFLPS